MSCMMLSIGKSSNWIPGDLKSIQDDLHLLVCKVSTFNSTLLWLCEILLFSASASDITIAKKHFRALLKPTRETGKQIEQLMQKCLANPETFDNAKGYMTEELFYQFITKCFTDHVPIRNARFKNQDGPICGNSNLDIFWKRKI